MNLISHSPVGVWQRQTPTAQLVSSEVSHYGSPARPKTYSFGISSVFEKGRSLTHPVRARISNLPRFSGDGATAVLKLCD